MVYSFAAKWCLRGVFVKAVFKNQMLMAVIVFTQSLWRCQILNNISACILLQ